MQDALGAINEHRRTPREIKDADVAGDDLEVVSFVSVAGTKQGKEVDALDTSTNAPASKSTTSADGKSPKEVRLWEVFFEELNHDHMDIASVDIPATITSSQSQ
ncbi:864_t:CDS:2, partial [Racocetra fulgida]